ncbi:MAG: RHS repeat-associated core domain-containing protein [Eubacteriales bacterium]|nr:RHS repeat-associated core domain-containing protein [Eubacteriales bacterium]
MNKTRKRLLSAGMALLLAIQPCLLTAAQTEEQTVTETEEFTLRSNVDGTKTVTFHAQLEGSSGEEGNSTGAAGSRKSPSPEVWMEAAEGPELSAEGEESQTETAPQLEMEVSGTGEDAEVTMEYGGTGLVFTPEIFEAEQETAAPAQDGEEAVPETAGTAAVQTEVHLAAAEGDAETRAAEECPQPAGAAPQPPQENTQPEEAAPAETAQETGAPDAEETQGQEQAPETGQPETEAGQMTEGPSDSWDTEGEETAAETGEGTDTEPATAAGPEAAADTETAADTEPETVSDTESETGTESETDTEPETETEGPAPEIPDSEIRYRELENGIKEEMVMYGYRKERRVEYRFSLDGLSPVREGNAFKLVNGEGEALFTIDAPYMYDAAGRQSRDITVAMEHLGGSDYLLSYVPDDGWLADEGRTWPVVLDPTITITGTLKIEDNYVGDAGQAGNNFDYGKSTLLAGNKGGINYTAFIRPALPESLKNIASKVIIQSASVRLNAGTVEGEDTAYGLYLVKGSWTSQSITGKNQPDLSAAPYVDVSFKKGWNTVDIKSIVSEWFNCLAQKENCGFAIKAEKKRNNYVSIYSSDSAASKDVEFSITYKEIPESTDAGIRAKVYGNAANSGTGYVELSWNRVAGAEGYYVGIFDGKDYEYFLVGNVTKYTTKGKGIWPTAEEIRKGRYRLHGDGTGAELPCIPADSYGNVENGTHGKDLKYYFCVVPCNEYGQAIDPGTFDSVSAVLPDRISPSQAAAVTVIPSTATNKAAVKVGWNGIRDFNTTSASITNGVGKGKIQFSVDGTSNWKDTDQNGASGSYTVDVSGLEDGTHTIYIRGKDGEGNTGAAKGTYLYIDRTGPQGQTVSVEPKGWSAVKKGILSWSGMWDLYGIGKIEYAFDNGPWKDTGKQAEAYAGLPLDFSGLSDGIHTLSLRGTDTVGNTGKASSAKVRMDRTAPEAGSIRLEPEGWSAGDTFLLKWEGISDAASGIGRIEYALDGKWEKADSTEGSGEVTVPAKGLAEGEHEVLLRAFDRAGNVSDTLETVLKRDTISPQAEITAPADGAILDGQVKIEGYAEDENLAGWELTARDSSGNEKQLASWKKTEEGDGEGEGTEVPGTIDLADYPDGENVTLTLRAEDEAGNVTEKSLRIIRVGGSMEPFAAEVGLDLPRRMTKAREYGTYQVAEGEQETVLYIDGIPAALLSGGTAAVDAVCYEEESTHTASIITVLSDGSLSYGKGFGGQQLMEELWEQGAPGERGIWRSGELSAAGPMMALRLDVTDYAPGSSSIRYECSADGQEWQEICPGKDLLFDRPADRVEVRACFSSGDGKEEPELYRLSLQGVIEMDPSVFSVHLADTAGNISVRGPHTVSKALTEITFDGTGGLPVQWYLNGKKTEFSENRFDARFVEEGKNAALFGAVLGENGELRLSGAGSSTLLRENVHASGTVISGPIRCPEGTTAIKLKAASGDGTEYFISTDGQESWIPLEEGRPMLLAEQAENIVLRAETGESDLAGWHLQGYTAGAYTVRAQLVFPPRQITAWDYGDFEEQRYELKWSDTQEEDGTAEYETLYRIYRNGEPVGTSENCIHTDEDYQKDASYSVSKVRKYREVPEAEYAIRESSAAEASLLKMNLPAEEEPEEKEEATPVKRPVNIRLEETAQDEALSSLYGGDRTFSLKEDPPSAERALDQSLLGKSRHCALGFEPVNFNTGNFLLEARDGLLECADGTSFDLTRIYNARSEDTDGPFGARWSSEYSQYLQVYQDGTTGYRKADGALILYTPSGQGYQTSTSDGCVLEKTPDGYEVTSPEGKIYGFGKDGLLKNITEKGRRTELIRDGRKVLSEVRLADGRTIEVRTDEKGHITRLTWPGGAAVSYGYSGNDLVEVTDELGNSVRYVYDEKGRMTEWYDKAGNRQVRNEYDEQDRVIFQEDAREGRYTLEYFEDHTVTTDAEGVKCEVWFDSRKRTVKEVDGNGGEISYTYDDAGNLSGILDAEGRLTTYEYDENGNQTGTILPDGTNRFSEYDENGNLLSETDGNGNKTTYEYDSDNRLIKIVYADGAQESYVYDAEGNITSQTDTLGNTITYTYRDSQITSITDALGNVTACEYDDAGNLIKEIAADGGVNTYEYDKSGNCVRENYPDGTSISYEYDVLGNLVKETNPLGQTVTYEYDVLSNCIKTIFADGSSEEKEYSPNGDILSETDCNGNVTRYTYDANGNMLTETDALGNTTTYKYNTDDLMTEMVLPNGARASYEYDESSGLLIKSTDIDGEENTFEYDAEGNVTANYQNGELVYARTYDNRNRLASQTYGDGSSEYYEYDAAGNLIKIIDALGGITSYNYNENNNLLFLTDAMGNTTEYAYDCMGNISYEKDARGAVTEYTYDSVGNLISETDALGNVTTWEYDGNDQPVKEIDAAGNETLFRYDTDGNLVETTFADGGKNRFTYDRNGNLLTETDAMGGTNTCVYDAAGNLVQMTDALGRTANMDYDPAGNLLRTKMPDIEEKFEYNAGGLLTAETDPTGGRKEYCYDDGGRLVSQSMNGGEISYEYDLRGNISKLTDAAGDSIEFIYDIYGRVKETCYPDGTSDFYSYDALGRLELLEERDGSRTEYFYDECGNLILELTDESEIYYEYDLLGRVTSVDENGAVTKYTYDNIGNLLTETDPEGFVMGYEYNCMGDVTAVNYPDGSRSTASYDLGGRMTKETDTQGNTVYYRYDALSHLVGLTDALGGEFSYVYNGKDEIEQVTDALGHSTYYTCDGAGNVISEKDALGNVTEYSYTPEGWLSGTKEADGSVRIYIYDEVGNLLEEHCDGQLVRKNTWDSMGNLLASEDEKGRMEFTVDAFGSVTAVTWPDGRKVSYAYDENGRLAVLTYPDGTSVSYEYDDCGRMVSVTDQAGIATSYTYDLSGNLTGEKSAGVDIAYTYDGFGEILRIEVTGTKELTLEYERDRNGNIIKETRREKDGISESRYTYDALNRLTGFDTENVSEKYVYDAAGNMTEHTRCADGVTTTTVSVYNEANQLTEQTDGEGTTSFRYNAKGDLVEKERDGKKAVYTYNADGMLSGYTDFEGNRTELYYTPSGSLMEKRTTPAGETQARVTQYLYNVMMEDCQILSETIDGSTISYAYGVGKLGTYTEGKTSRYLYDARGSIIADITGDKAEEYRYYPYGEFLTGAAAEEETTQAETADIHGYNGEAYHADLGMIYLRARWYDPAQMRFSQKDIVQGEAEEPQSLNRYAYACDNPVSYGDPSGEYCLPSIRRNTPSFGSLARKSYSPGTPARRTTSTSTNRSSYSRTTGANRVKYRRVNLKSTYSQTMKAAAKKSSGTKKTTVRKYSAKKTSAGTSTRKVKSSGRTTVRTPSSGKTYGGGNGRSSGTANSNSKTTGVKSKYQKKASGNRITVKTSANSKKTTVKNDRIRTIQKTARKKKTEKAVPAVHKTTKIKGACTSEKNGQTVKKGSAKPPAVTATPTSIGAAYAYWLDYFIYGAAGAGASGAFGNRSKKNTDEADWSNADLWRHVLGGAKKGGKIKSINPGLEALAKKVVKADKAVQKWAKNNAGKIAIMAGVGVTALTYPGIAGTITGKGITQSSKSGNKSKKKVSNQNGEESVEDENFNPDKPSKLQEEIKRGKAPRDVKRVDDKNEGGAEKPHVHFKDGTSLNNDGTIHDKGKGIPKPSKNVRKWLEKHGWKVNN